MRQLVNRKHVVGLRPAFCERQQKPFASLIRRSVGIGEVHHKRVLARRTEPVLDE